MIGIVFALPQEMAPLRAKVELLGEIEEGGFTFHLASLEGERLIMASSGLGIGRAREAASRLLEIFNIEAIISAGLAGGVKEGISSGELVVAENVLYTPEGIGSGGFSGYACHQALVQQSYKLARDKGFGVRLGDILTVDRVIHRPDLKREIGEDSTAVAIDMESSGVAEAARARGIPFLALRAISDEVGEELKACDLIDGGGRLRPLRLILYLINNPQDIIYLKRLRNRSTAASQNLAWFLTFLIKGCRKALAEG